jgi:hypothetical protein
MLTMLTALVLVLAQAPPPQPGQPGQPGGVDERPAPRLSRSSGRSALPRGMAPVISDTLTANPYAYREWLRRKVDEDLAELYKVTTDLVALLDPASPGDAEKAGKQAAKVVKLSHNVWNNLQMRKPTRERPKRDPGARPRGLAASHADAEAARALVREIAEGVATEQRSRDLDAARRVGTLERLERLERIGLQLEVDADARR